MKTLKHLFCFFLITATYFACNQDDDNTDFINEFPAPTNVSALVTVTQDNTGLVTITPLGEGANTFVVNYGDGSENTSEILRAGYNTQHTYAEGVYLIAITAIGINGKTTTVTQEIVVSFQAPQNLMVTIENDSNVSKQVNVTGSAEFALSYEVDFGELGSTPIMGNINDTVSYTYQEPGTYTITVTAFSAAVETTSYSEAFLVTEILAPLNAAPEPPARVDADVVSVFSDAYTNVTLDELPTVWSSSGFEATTVGTDNIWKLTTLDFLGIVTNYANGIDVSAMETLHIDYWVPSGTTNELLVKIVNTVDGGEDIESLGTTVGGSWQSIDIDMTAFDDGNLANKEKITQIIIDSDGVSDVVYIDNFYFYRAASVQTQPILPVGFESPTFDYGIFSFGGANFEPIPASVIINPVPSGINTTENVFELVKPSGAQVWAGAGINLAGGTDFSEGTTILVDVYSPTAGTPILYKMEDSSSPLDGNGNPTVFLEVQATTTVANQWETLAFDLTTFAGFSTSNAYDRAIFFANFGNSGTGATYYFDNIRINGATPPSPSIPINFESTLFNYGTFSFGGANVAIVTNPNMSGINTSGKVFEIVKTSGAQVWAGAGMGLAGATNFANGTTLNIDVWSPTAGTPILLKMEASTSPPRWKWKPKCICRSVCRHNRIKPVGNLKF
ncbi:hypothetical protein N7U66_03620 [Lacinutrix neustonica]|uniref:PKD domain-containing protein n=1 Tax=Lacinutrix neustonica TaxID=2980107 RepID=A0A9E8MXP0_9FLAO|nr:PKD domain-containing protein [Lacinutrix neustonica]WAC02769.1 hypothetical protein N7U66_03620 [Lacinutrix neustonica]